MNEILLIVDPQIDFITGSLPVPGAEEAIAALSRYILERPDAYARKIVSLDFHPWNHCSFAENGGDWPRHCVAYDGGSSVFPALLNALHSTEGETEFLLKGQSRDADQYSIFMEPANLNKLFPILSEADRIDICGIAGDVCVLNTLRDGVRIFGPEKFRVLREFSPSLDGGKSLDDYIGGL
ncbi:MAG: isochorismatase family protein [Desulfovibrio sp.]|nr:isochorismatase family protein [Desulfovibrio sp.]